jgi:protein-disulfide isomerase
MKKTSTKLNKIVAFSLATLGLCFSYHSALAANTATFTPEQKAAIEKIMHDYLVAHPTVLIEATQALQKQQQQEMVSNAESAIKKNGKSLFNEPASPVLGNPKGNVTLVEFFDYQCNVCQRMAPTIDSLIQKNPNLRVELKQWPIFGATSEYAAKAALASVEQNKFSPFYQALITAKGRLDESRVLAMALKVGLNTEQLKKDMKNPSIDKELANNLKLAEAMRLAGTPAFIIAKTPNGIYANAKTSFVPGGASESSLQELIKKNG